MRSLALATALAAVLLGAAGCGDGLNTDPSIFVEAKVEDPYLDVQKKGALGADVTGGFTLTLHLGPRAADSTKVALEGFQLVSEDQNTLIVDSLPLRAEGATLPVTVDPGDDKDIEILIDYGGDLATQEEGDKLCSFGLIRFRGSISDSLRGSPQPVLTDPVDVTSCKL
jgi:hypothetical protein